MGAKKRGSSLRGPFVGITLLLAAIFYWRYFYFSSFTTLSNYVLPTTTRFLGTIVEPPCACPQTNASCPPVQAVGQPKVRVVVEEKIVEKVVEKVVEKIVEVESKSKPWYAKGKPWHTEREFHLCSMDVCFNYSRCENQEELLVYSYQKPSFPNRFFEGLNLSSWHTTDPEAACLFFVFPDWLFFAAPFTEPEQLPYWNHGMNHVIVTFSDIWHFTNGPPNLFGNASVLASNLLETTYRPGFDIGIPLPGRWHQTQARMLSPFQRKYFLTFRGIRYVGPYSAGTFRSFDSFRDMHNGEDVIIAATCEHPQNKEKIDADPAYGAHCDEDGEIHKRYGSFTDLMNTTFGLAPAGISSSSYRLIEVLSAGAIPVVIADNYVKPFENLIQWPRCMLQFPTDQMHRILPALRTMSKKDIRARQKYCLLVYDEFLKNDETLLRTAMRALKARFYGAFSRFSDMSDIYSEGSS